MTKKEIRKASKINMRHFLEIYFKFGDERTIEKLVRLSHFEIKELAREYDERLKKIPFEALTKDMLARGDVILVVDAFGHTAPYINPLRRIEKEFETTLGEAYVSHEVYEEVDEDDKHKGRQKTKHFKA